MEGKKLRAGFSPKRANAEDIAKIEALGNIALSLTPGIGFLKDGGELLSGKDSVTGEALGVGGTLLAGIGLTGIPADEAAKILKAIKSLRGTDEAARIADELAEAATDAGRQADGFAEGQVVAPTDVKLKYMNRWTDAQKAAADTKAKALTEADTRVVKNPQRSGTAQSLFRKEAGVNFMQDADHLIDLQVGGEDVIDNLWGLDKSVNRSLGSQIQHAIKDLAEGSPLARFYFE